MPGRHTAKSKDVCMEHGLLNTVSDSAYHFPSAEHPQVLASSDSGVGSGGWPILLLWGHALFGFCQSFLNLLPIAKQSPGTYRTPTPTRLSPHHLLIMTWTALGCWLCLDVSPCWACLMCCLTVSLGGHQVQALTTQDSIGETCSSWLTWSQLGISWSCGHFVTSVLCSLGPVCSSGGQ